MEGDDTEQYLSNLRIEVPRPLPASSGTLETPPGGSAVFRGAHGLDRQRRHVWTGPFATTQGSSPAGGDGRAMDDDVTMATVSLMQATHDAQLRITNAPSLPSAPRYSGSTMKSRREFMRAYETYVHALSAFDTAFSRPFVMPVSGCIEERTCRLICMYELRKDPNHVTEDEWIAYFRQALEPELEDYTTVDLAMKQLKMKTALPDAMSRMGQLRSDMHRILDEHNMEQVLMAQEQKKGVKYFVDALEPTDFREAILKRLEYSQHKRFKSDIVLCYGWSLDQLRAYLVWQPVPVPAKPSVKPANKSSEHKQRPPDGGNHKPTAARTNTASKSEAPKPQTATRPRLSCLKCNSTEHLVRQCPDVRPGEVETLLAARQASAPPRVTRMDKVTVPATLGTDTGRSARAPVEDETGATAANIEGLTVHATLLDSGANASLVSSGVVQALEKSGAFLMISQATTTLSPVGDAKIIVTRKIRLSGVSLDTSAGPLLLRNLECWVHEQDTSLSLTIGRPVVRRLGYSTNGLLAAARGRREEYCLTDSATTSEPDAVPTPLVRMQALMERALCEPSEQDQSDEIDELFTSPHLAATTTSAVQEALSLKVQEALDQGLHSAEGEQLRELLFRYVDVFRLSFGNDPPVRVPPFRVRLKEGARPVKAKSRRYPPAHKNIWMRI